MNELFQHARRLRCVTNTFWNYSARPLPQLVQPPSRATTTRTSPNDVGGILFITWPSRGDPTLYSTTKTFHGHVSLPNKYMGRPIRAFQTKGEPACRLSLEATFKTVVNQERSGGRPSASTLSKRSRQSRCSQKPCGSTSAIKTTLFRACGLSWCWNFPDSALHGVDYQVL